MDSLPDEILAFFVSEMIYVFPFWNGPDLNLIEWSWSATTNKETLTSTDPPDRGHTQVAAAAWRNLYYSS